MGRRKPKSNRKTKRVEVEEEETEDPVEADNDEPQEEEEESKMAASKSKKPRKLRKTDIVVGRHEYWSKKHPANMKVRDILQSLLSEMSPGGEGTATERVDTILKSCEDAGLAFVERVKGDMWREIPDDKRVRNLVAGMVRRARQDRQDEAGAVDLTGDDANSATAGLSASAARPERTSSSEAPTVTATTTRAATVSRGGGKGGGAAAAVAATATGSTLKPTDADILVGSTPLNLKRDHPGNFLFYDVIMELLGEFSKATSPQKQGLVQQVVDRQKGRFMELRHGTWNLLDNDTRLHNLVKRTFGRFANQEIPMSYLEHRSGNHPLNVPPANEEDEVEEEEEHVEDEAADDDDADFQDDTPNGPRKLRATDIIVGRGMKPPDQPGNNSCWELVEQYAHLFQVEDARGKAAHKVMRKIKAAGGAFVERSGREWIEITDDKRIRSLVGNMFRRWEWMRDNNRLVPRGAKTEEGDDDTNKQNESDEGSNSLDQDVEDEPPTTRARRRSSADQTVLSVSKAAEFSETEDEDDAWYSFKCPSKHISLVHPDYRAPRSGPSLHPKANVYVKEPNQRDVLLATNVHEHPGNLLFLRILRKKCHTYQEAAQPALIVEEVLDEVKARGARFVEATNKDVHVACHEWMAIRDQERLEKIVTRCMDRIVLESKALEEGKDAKPSEVLVNELFCPVITQNDDSAATSRAEIVKWSKKPAEVVVETPLESDVVFSRGGSYKYTPGNVAFKKAVMEHIDDFNATTKKAGAIQKVIDKVLLHGGRFLQRQHDTVILLQDQQRVYTVVKSSFQECNRYKKGNRRLKGRGKNHAWKIMDSQKDDLDDSPSGETEATMEAVDTSHFEFEESEDAAMPREDVKVSAGSTSSNGARRTRSSDAVLEETHPLPSRAPATSKRKENEVQDEPSLVSPTKKSRVVRDEPVIPPPVPSSGQYEDDLEAEAALALEELKDFSRASFVAHAV